MAVREQWRRVAEPHELAVVDRFDRILEFHREQIARIQAKRRKIVLRCAVRRWRQQERKGR